jgi:predicted RNA-binding protein Jag
MTSEVQNTLIGFIHLLVDPINPGAEIVIEREGDQWRVNLLVGTEEILVGKDGDVLRSIQHLARVLVHRKHSEDKSHFILDVNHYRKAREYAISNIIPQIAENDVLSQGHTIILVGLSGYERLQVHKILSEIKGLNTNSVGPEDNRKLLIMPTSETGSTSMEKAKIYHIDQIRKLQEKI